MKTTINKENIRKEIKKIKSHLAELERQVSEPEVKGPWRPIGGDWLACTWRSALNGKPISVSSAYAGKYRTNLIDSGRTFETEKKASDAMNFLIFYQRYYSLALELNSMYAEPENRYSCSWNNGMETWDTHRTDRVEDIWHLFTSKKSALSAKKIMNRDGWLLPKL
jgi:hypothetical protein